MACLSPLTIKIDEKSKSYAMYQSRGINSLLVPCGRCINCIKKKRNEWVYRLGKELEQASTAYFVTITYDDDHLPLSEENKLPTLNKEHCKIFLDKLVKYGQKRWQQYLSGKGFLYKDRKDNRVKIKYFLVGEYGGSYGRPHYHFILFDYPADIEKLCMDIKHLWSFQSTIPDIRYLNLALINYITKYMLPDSAFQPTDYLDCFPPFRLMSKGLGMKFINSYNANQFLKYGKHTDKIGSRHYSLPRYIQSKLKDLYFNNDDMKIRSYNAKNYVHQLSKISEKYEMEKSLNINSDVSVMDLLYTYNHRKRITNSKI